MIDELLDSQRTFPSTEFGGKNSTVSWFKISGRGHCEKGDVVLKLKYNYQLS